MFLKICRADLRLLTERDHLHFVEGMIRGMSSVYAKKYWKANNQYLADHNKNEDYFKDYPPAPSKEIVQITDLSTDQVEMMGKLGITSLPKVPKLIQSLQKKVTIYFALSDP